jgi:predicted DNA-binding transcriptional regulator YafY
MKMRRRRKTGTFYNPDALLRKGKLLIDEAAFLLQVTPRTVQRYMADGKLAYSPTPGGQRRPLTVSVRKYL